MIIGLRVVIVLAKVVVVAPRPKQARSPPPAP
jgi:hypothetical protein